MTNEEIRRQLESIADEGYKQFTAKLIPNINIDSMLGIRIPMLRKFAKAIIKDDWKSYLDNAVDDSYEEIMLQGMVIGHVDTELSRILPYVESHIPKISNWALCDTFCSGLKLPRKYPTEMWDFITPYLCDDRPYYIRFGVVMTLEYYIEESYLQKLFQHFNKIHSDDYYVKMAIAWAISMCYVRYPDSTLKYLIDNQLDDFTYNKSLQKIIESLKVDNENKKAIRSMKRKVIRR